MLTTTDESGDHMEVYNQEYIGEIRQYNLPPVLRRWGVDFV